MRRIRTAIAATLFAALAQGAHAQATRHDPAASQWLTKIAVYVQDMGRMTMLATDCNVWDIVQNVEFISSFFDATEKLPPEDKDFAGRLFSDGQILANREFKGHPTAACAVLTPKVIKVLGALASGEHGFWDWP